MLGKQGGQRHTRRSLAMALTHIKIEGARQNNLRNLHLKIPRDVLVVITGPSGSGKSSLAFDTLYAEGQRKYVESLSAYARQFLDQLKKPELDHIEGLSPTIAIEQRGSVGGPRSIVATTTELFDYLRLLYAHAGRRFCPESGERMVRRTTTELIDMAVALPEKSRLILLAPIHPEPGEKPDEVLARLAREGYVRARVDGEILELGAGLKVDLEGRKKPRVEVVVDRLVVQPESRGRLADSMESSLKLGGGKVILQWQTPEQRESGIWAEEVFSNQLMSRATGRVYPDFEPRDFSFNSPSGACPTCHGLGQKLVFDPELVVPDETKSLAQGVVVPWTRGPKRMQAHYQTQWHALVEHYGVHPDAPWRGLPESFRNAVLHGTGAEKITFHSLKAGKVTQTSKPFEGVLPMLERQLEETQSEATRKRLKAFMGPRPCEVCEGRRLKPEILAVRLGESEDGKPGLPGKSIMDACRLSIREALVFFRSLHWTDTEQQIVGDLIREITSRLGFLEDVGLGYLSLDRESATLSGGEAQRIRLATQIGAGLVGVLYVLDEPSIGLHQRDNEKLIRTLLHLRDLGNSVVVVEHDEDTIRQADHVLDMGPGAGRHGGEVVAQGTLEEILNHPDSLTGRYLSGALSIPVPRQRVPVVPHNGRWLEVLGARENNLQDIDVGFPIGAMTCVTGVSGGGKSSLVDDILRVAVSRQLHGARGRPGLHREIRGLEHLDKVIVIDQAPLGRTPRSNPATYTGLFQHLRGLFAQLPASRVRGYDAGRFSFNVKGGRCEACQGDGVRRIEMHFLPPVFVTCEACEGLRYNRETLEVQYKGKNIAEVLDMTVDDAVHFFRSVPPVLDMCQVLAEVGLGYLKLGQSATSLSGGEAQRVKLAAELARKSTGRTLYLLDEPTTGLHFHDVAKLLEVLLRLRDGGNTLIVIEHHLDVIKCADWVVDLGPEGGDQGGRLVVAGTPEQVSRCEASHTGRFLGRILESPKA